MTFELKSKEMNVKISDTGAELISARCASGYEYIWQGDEKYWAGQCPVLFPICGRLFGGHYTLNGKVYDMNIHGFARKSLFTASASGDNSVTLTLISDQTTKSVYPFDFRLDITYTLKGNKLCCDNVISNTGTVTLPATFGAHPGFNVPFGSDGCFEDYFLEFGKECSPDRLVLSDTCFNTGKKEALPLENSRILPLRHSLFDNDAVFMSRMADSVTLKSDKSERYVRMEYSGMPYLGIWHKPKSDAPYICIEPWCGLPSFDGETDDLATKCDMFRIMPGASVNIGYSVIFG